MLAQFRHTEHRLAAIYVWKWCVLDSYGELLGSALIAACVSILVDFARVSPLRVVLPDSVPTSVAVATWPAFFLAFALASWPMWFLRPHQRQFFPTPGFVVGWVTCIPLLYVAFLLWVISEAPHRTLGPTLFVVVNATLWAVVLAASLAIWLAILVMIKQFLWHRERSTAPEAVIVDNLFNVLLLIQKKQSWQDLGTKRRINMLLDDTARCLELYLPRALGSLLGEQREWLKAEARNMGAAVREMSKHVALSGQEDRDRLTAEVKAAAIAALSGNWTAMPRTSRSGISGLARFRLLLGRLLRASSLGLIPLLVLLVLQRTPLALSGDLGNYAKLGGWLWLVVSIIHELDPQAETRLTLFRDVSEIFRQWFRGSKPS
jgi:hypothetical protein